MKFDDKGRELLDDTPIEVPAGFKRPETIHDMIKRYIRSEAFAAKMQAEGKETEDEANDFEIEDEDEDVAERFLSRHEVSAMAADELKDLAGREEWDRLRAQFKPKENGNGSKQGQSGVDGAGSVGKESKGDGGAERGNSAGNRKAASGATKSADPGEFAEQG